MAQHFFAPKKKKETAAVLNTETVPSLRPCLVPESSSSHIQEKRECHESVENEKNNVILKKEKENVTASHKKTPGPRAVSLGDTEPVPVPYSTPHMRAHC